jgi:hypothetical protein
MTFGIGYGGALAAWMRLKYPHLVKGAIASSATINAITDFQEFDLATAHILGDRCGPAVREAVNGMTSLLDSDLDRAHLDSIFASAQLSDDDMMLLVRDAVTLPVVYGRMHDLCATVLAAQKSGESPIHALAKHINENFIPHFAPAGLADYTLTRLQDTRLPSAALDAARQEAAGSAHPKPAAPGADKAAKAAGNPDIPMATSSRQWLYQQCTEMGQFKTSAREGAGVIPHRLTTAFYHERCHAVFGVKLWPDVDQTNRAYGRDMIASSHIFFLNGGQDPYRLASVSHAVRPSEPAMVIRCYNCAHAVDLRGCPSGPVGALAEKEGHGVCQDQQAILNARKATMHYMNLFIKTP